MAQLPEAPGPVEGDDIDADLPTEVVVRDMPVAEAADVEPEPDADPDADFPTEVVDRSAPASDDDEAVEATFATIALDRRTGAGAAPEVDPAEPAGDTDAPPAPRPSLRGRRTARRRGITFPPMEPTARPAVPAVGPGAVESYPVRELAPPPPPPALVESGPESTRAPAPAMPSVERRTRRTGRITLALVAAAILVSALGLAGIASLVLG